MKSLRGIVGKHLKSFNGTTTTPESSQKATTSKPQAPGLLSLPGELRNKIYSFAIFPELDELFIPNCTRPSDIARTILNPSVFRVSQQVRAESLSWLLVNKRLIFFGISSFNALCKTVGPRVKDIQSCRIVVTARFDIVNVYAENLFRNLEAASALARLHLEVGVIAWRAAAEGQTQDGAARREWEFFVRLNEFVKSKGDDFVFKWSMWSFHELGVFMHEQQKAALGELFGMDAESEESQGI